MKKKLLIFLVVLSLLLYTGCGNTESSGDITEEDPGNTAEESMETDTGNENEEAGADIKDLLISPYSDIDFDDYLMLPDYDSFEVEKITPAAVTDEDVEKEINKMLNDQGETENITEGVVEKGDKVEVSFEGKLKDGTPVDGISSESFTLKVGEEQMVEGFQEGLIGKKIGEPFELEITFPDSYPSMPELAGQDTVFDITVNKKIVVIPAELTDELVSSVSDCKTVDEYRKEIRQKLENDNKEAALEEEKNSVYSMIESKTEMKQLNEKRITECKDSMLERYQKVAQDYNLEWSYFVENVFGSNVDEFEVDLIQYANQIVKQEMIIYAIAEKEGITATEEELDDFIKQQLQNTGYKDEEDFENRSGMTIYEYVKNNNLVINYYLNKEKNLIYDRLTGDR